MILSLITINLFAGPGKNKINGFINALKAYKPGNSSALKKIGNFIDLDFIGRRSMNLHWKKMSDKQKKEFHSLFSKVIEKRGYRRSSNYFRNNKYKILSERKISKKDYMFSRKKMKIDLIEVKVEVDYKTNTGIEKEQITFYLSKQSGKLMIFDIIMLEGSTVKDFRNQFSKTIRKKGGVDGLLNQLKEKLEED